MLIVVPLVIMVVVIMVVCAVSGEFKVDYKAEE